jgi:hypothetical protein
LAVAYDRDYVKAKQRRIQEATVLDVAAAVQTPGAEKDYHFRPLHRTHVAAQTAGISVQSKATRLTSANAVLGV